MVAPNDTGHLKTQANEFVKQHIEYDGSNRAEYVYTAPANLENGKPCSVVRYSYAAGSVRVVYMKESTAAWNTAWEVF